MSDCQKTLDLLSLHLVGETENLERQSMDRHLSGCAGCRGEAEKLRSLLDALSESEVPDPGEIYWKAFLPRLRKRMLLRESRLRVSYFRMASSLAASLAVFLLAALVMGQWDAPVGWNPSAQLDQLAEESDPGEFQGVMDEMLFGTAYPVAAGDGADLLAPVDEMQWALESLMPPREGEIYSRVEELSPSARDWLLGTLDTSHV